METPKRWIFALLTLVSSAAAPAVEVAWPAEPFDEAVNLTQSPGPGNYDFHVDLSGAYWNPHTRRLWVCRNGGPGGSKFWVLKEDGNGGFEVDYRDGLRGEWTNFGDLEDLTQAELLEDTIYLMIEGQERIKEFDISTYGTAILRNDWNITPFVPPYDGYSGSEGIAFIPDYYLEAGGFVDFAGNPRVSQNGMGGLMFVAHQKGGHIYVFDLNRSNSTYTFVGRYRTNFHESCALSFDRTSGYLYILHGANHNRVEVTSLSSSLYNGERRLNEILTYGRPTNSAINSNMEGIAIVSGTECNSNVRRFFLTIDDGGPNSLLMFRQFPCLDIGDVNGDGAINGLDIQGALDDWLQVRPRPNTDKDLMPRGAAPNVESLVRRLLDL